MTETWGGIMHDGLPLSGVEVRLAGPDANDIEVRTPTVMHGYLGDDTATRAAFTEDGWLRTGDIGAWNADGTLSVIDRRKDVILSGGVTVIPALVDAALHALPGCRDAAVVGVADSEWGERVVACVVWDETTPPSLDALRDALRTSLPASALPREVRFVTEIPRSAGGKLLRRALRDATQIL
jgi:acyl-CoA synthetase (AMP-forming)/AMP-acid ligase II